MPEFTDNVSEDENQTQLGFFETGINNKTATNELYQYIQLPGRSRGKLAKDHKR